MSRKHPAPDADSAVELDGSIRGLGRGRLTRPRAEKASGRAAWGGPAAGHRRLLSIAGLNRNLRAGAYPAFIGPADASPPALAA